MGKHDDRLNEFFEEHCKCKNCINYLFGKCRIDSFDRTFSPDSRCEGFMHVNPDLKKKEEELKENWYQEHLEEIGEA